MSLKAIQAKQDFVQTIANELKQAKSFIVFEYSGLTAKKHHRPKIYFK